MDDHPAWLQLATQAGSHALALFFGTWALGLGAAWLVCRRLHRPAPAAPAAISALSATALLLRLLTGLVVIVGSAAAFAEIAEHLREAPTLGHADEAFMAALMAHPLPDALLNGFYGLTLLGNRASLTGLAVVVALALWMRRQRLLALGWSLAMAGNGLLNPMLKNVFERVRPAHPTHLLVETGFSFPSGHSSGAVVAFGMLAYVGTRLLPPRRHPLLWCAALSLALSVGASRVFLRVHYPSDVLAGFASGGAWLLVCVLSLELTRWTRQRRSARASGSAR